MRPVPRLVLAVLALLSLFATGVPQVAWACSASARIGTPQEVCVPSCPMTSHSARRMACCQPKPAKPLTCTLGDASHTPKLGGSFTGACCRPFPLLPTTSVVATVPEKSRRTLAPPVPDGRSAAIVPTVATSPNFTGVFRLLVYPAQASPHFQLSSWSLYAGRAPPYFPHFAPFQA